jgi:hypothetical protein
MLLRMLTAVALLLSFSTAVAAQDAKAVIVAASKAMGADNLTSITYSGTARNGAFGQSKSIGDPMGPVNTTQISAYTRAVTFAPAASPPPSFCARPARRSRQRFPACRRRCQGSSTRTSPASRPLTTGVRR